MSQKSIRLLRCSRYSVDRVDIDEVAGGLVAVLGRYDTKTSQLQFHTGAGDSAGDRPALFHGHGVGIDDSKDEIFRYFQIVGRKLAEVLTPREAPVVMAGVEYLLPIFRFAAPDLHLLEEGIAGNPEELKDEALQQRGWPLVEPHFRQDLQEDVQRIAALEGTGLASTDFKTVLQACVSGRTETLFFGKGRHRFGTCDPQDHRIELHETEMPGDEELVDLAAVEAFRRGGAVYALDPDEVPGGGVLAAVLRY